MFHCIKIFELSLDFLAKLLGCSCRTCIQLYDTELELEGIIIMLTTVSSVFEIRDCAWFPSYKDFCHLPKNFSPEFRCRVLDNFFVGALVEETLEVDWNCLNIPFTFCAGVFFAVSLDSAQKRESV